MHEEAGFFKSLFEWFEWLKDNYEWFSWIAGGVGFVLYKIHRYFAGLNRIASVQETQAKEITEIKTKLDKMVDGEGVDLRVKPVIEAVINTQSQVNEIHSYFMNRSRNERHDD